MKVDQIICGDAIGTLKTFPAESVHCCATSPPYWRVRDYGLKPLVWDGDPRCRHRWGDYIKGQERHPQRGLRLAADKHYPRKNPRNPTADEQGKINGVKDLGAFCQRCGAWKGSLGLEPTPQMYTKHLVAAFREVWRVLRADGSLWLNLGDSYCSQPSAMQNPASFRRDRMARQDMDKRAPGLKKKDLVGIPWRVAFALQEDGWYLRSDIIWHKPNPMPESVRDRPTKAHEYLFLLTKSNRYYYDYKAIQEPCTGNAHARGSGVNPKAMKAPSGWDSGDGGHTKKRGRYPKSRQNPSFSAAVRGIVKVRNKRSVWTISTQGFKGAHFATFPEKLIEPCVLAGCPKGGTVLDPFSGGSGRLQYVARRLGRHYVGIDQKGEYCKMGRRQIKKVRRES